MAGELDEVRILRLKLKAAKSLLRDLSVAVARCEEALDRARREPFPAQPKEGTAYDRRSETRCVA